jgi:hypothetical protein
MNEARDELLERLLELELDAHTLRDDPSGASWLPEDLCALVERDPECAAELREFVAVELELFAAAQPSDPFFTRRVLDALPPVAGVDYNRRNWILASAYALAIGVAYLLLGPLLSSGELASWFEPLGGWIESHAHAVEAGSMWVAVTLLLAAAGLVLLPLGRDGDREAGA